MVRHILRGIVVLSITAFAVLYVAAKVHFFKRFSGDFGAYWAEHWPYSAGLLVIAGITVLSIWALDRQAKIHSPEGGSRTKSWS